MKKLVTYFSASGVTETLAKKISETAEADLYEITPAQRYTTADLDWTNKKSRSSVEMNDVDCRPALADKDVKIDDYDTIFVGFPIWWGREPSVIDTFLESYDFSNKTIVMYATSGGSGMGQTAKRIRQLVGESTNVIDGKVISSRTSKEQIRRWLDGLK